MSIFGLNNKREHDHAVCVNTALKQATTVCAKEGVRLTSLRRQILELIWQNHKPLGAYTLMDMLEQSSNRKKVAPPTVYRTLDFLLAQGLIHKVHSLNAFIGCTTPMQKHNDALFICVDCGYTEEVRSDTIQQAINLSASQQKFSVSEQILEVVGKCARCRTATK